MAVVNDQSNLYKCSKVNCQKCTDRLCIKCAENYQKPSHVNHATCYPLEDLNNELLNVIQKVEGLELERFVRKTSRDRLAAVWDSLNYL